MLSHAKVTKALADLNELRLIDLVTFSDLRGNLTVVQSDEDIPFSIARIFYIYGSPRDCERGAHAHRQAKQVFIAVSGSFSLHVTNVHDSRTYAMKEPNRAVYVPPMIWARVHNFSSDGVCLVLTNTGYDPADYIRDWDEYVSAFQKLAR
jgi:mannose-6-phosphate isomerase-like protein (cupin superfamily)